jgi:hypothetical protein
MLRRAFDRRSTAREKCAPVILGAARIPLVAPHRRHDEQHWELIPSGARDDSFVVVAYRVENGAHHVILNAVKNQVNRAASCVGRGDLD